MKRQNREAPLRISTAESLLMEALWRHAPATAEDIFAEVGERQTWSETTVKTLLGRLLKKGAIAAERDGRRYLYRPLIARDDYVQIESRNLIDRLFGGRIAPLVSHFADREKLSPEDLAELKRIIAKLDDGR